MIDKKNKILISFKVIFILLEDFSTACCLNDKFYSWNTIGDSFGLLETSDLFIGRFIKEFKSIGIKIEIEKFLPKLNKTHKFRLKSYRYFSLFIWSFYICGQYKCFLFFSLIWHLVWNFKLLYTLLLLFLIQLFL